MRDPFSERDGIAMVKQKLRDRMNPKLGKIDIEYEVKYTYSYNNKNKRVIKLSIKNWKLIKYSWRQVYSLDFSFNWFCHRKIKGSEVSLYKGKGNLILLTFRNFYI